MIKPRYQPMCIFSSTRHKSATASVQQVPQHPKSMFPYSVGSFLSIPTSGSTKWQANIVVLIFDSVYMKKSYQDGRKFLLRNSLVKLLDYWKQTWWWKVAYTCSFLRIQYYLCINCIITLKKKFPSQAESILYKTGECLF